MKTTIFLLIALSLLTGSLSAQENRASVQLAAAVYEEEVTGNLDKAVELYQNILKEYPNDRPVAAKALYHLGLVNEKMGKDKAGEYFTRLINTYPDQTEVVNLAKSRLAALEGPGYNEGFFMRRILSGASDVGGILTADGKYILGLDWETGDMKRFEIANGQISLIKNKGPWDETDQDFNSQVLSRNGKQMAYDGYTKDWEPRIVIRNLDGSEVRTLYSVTGHYVMPFDWSPDAGYLLALLNKSDTKLSKNDTNELVLISASDGYIRVLRNIPSHLFMFENARYSPDGKFIAFSYMRDGNPPHGDIFLITSDGLNEIVVAGHPSEDRLLGWAPDGKNIVFLSDRSGTWDIWNVPVTGGKQQGEPELVKKDFGYNSEFLGIAPDGSFYYKVNKPSGGLYAGAVDLETGKILQQPSLVTTRYAGTPYNLSWSSDGNYLLYLSCRGNIGPENNLPTILSDATGEERFLSPPFRFVNQLSWSPDGHSIMAIGITVKDDGVFQIDAETSAITRLDVENGYVPHLCSDGKTLVYIKGGVMMITRHNLDTGEESEIVRNS